MTYLINERAEAGPLVGFFERDLNIDVDSLKVSVAFDDVFLEFSRATDLLRQAGKEQLRRIFENQDPNI